MITIRLCETHEDFAAAAGLMAELGDWDSAETEKLGFCAQDVVDFYYAAGGAPAGAYAPRSGLTLVGYVEADVGGCIAYRELEPAVCELKRLYVRPRFRGTGLGRGLVSDLIGRARLAGYRRMRLETVSFMGDAIRMYEAMGFVRRGPYYDIPDIFLPITIFMEKALEDPQDRGVSVTGPRG
jgi:GNAT superfamily N-acetyltransferase